MISSNDDTIMTLTYFTARSILEPGSNLYISFLLLHSFSSGQRHAINSVMTTCVLTFINIWENVNNFQSVLSIGENVNE